MKYWRQHVFLACIFLLALPLFAWIRWEPGPWLLSRLSASGLDKHVSIAGLEKRPLGLTLKAVHLQLTPRQGITVDMVDIRPAWSLLMRGIPAMRLEGHTATASFIAGISKRHDDLLLHDIHAHMNATMARELFPATALINTRGDVSISGHLRLHLPSGTPVSGNMVWRWAQARTTPTGTGPIGDFELRLDAPDSGRWSWRLQGGTRLSVQGHGKLQTVSPRPGQWRLQGTIDFRAKAEVLPITGGAEEGTITLSGTLMQPEIRLAAP